jgi:hypothetical protein
MMTNREWKEYGINAGKLIASTLIFILLLSRVGNEILIVGIYTSFCWVRVVLYLWCNIDDMRIGE